MRPTGRLVAAAVAVCITVAVNAAGVQQPVFRTTSDTVRLFVTVVDRDGRLVTALGRDDFEIRDDGDRQRITLFDSGPQPIRLAVLLDVSGSMEGNLPLLRAATEQLLPRLHRGDRVRIGSFGREVTIGPWLSLNSTDLHTALPTAIAPDAMTPLWRAIDDTMGAFGEEGDGRRVILVLSDGKDSGPMFRQRYVGEAEVIERARDRDVMIYAVGMRSRAAGAARAPRRPGRPQAILPADLPDAGLARVAEESGGGYTEIGFDENLAGAFARVADELHSQYMIGFTPPRRDGRAHAIDVRMRRPGLTPRARRSYIAPTD